MQRYKPLTSAVAPGIVAVFFMAGALRMPSTGAWYQSPGFFPMVAAAAMLLLSVILFIQEWWKIQKQQEPVEAKKHPISKPELIRALYIVFWMVLFLVLIWMRVSFLFSSALFLAGTVFFYERKRVLSNLIIIAVVAVGFYYIFTKFFFIPLP